MSLLMSCVFMLNTSDYCSFVFIFCIGYTISSLPRTTLSVSPQNSISIFLICMKIYGKSVGYHVSIQHSFNNTCTHFQTTLQSSSPGQPFSRYPPRNVLYCDFLVVVNALYGRIRVQPDNWVYPPSREDDERRRGMCV